MESSRWQEWIFVAGYVSFLVTVTWLVLRPWGND